MRPQPQRRHCLSCIIRDAGKKVNQKVGGVSVPSGAVVGIYRQVKRNFLKKPIIYTYRLEKSCII